MLAFEFTPIARERMQRRGYGPEEMLGSIPHFLSPDDARGAVEQIHCAYNSIGGGWRDRSGFKLDAEAGTLTYPGDPARQLIAKAKLRDEEILFFNGAWISVRQPDGSFRTSCID